jgi:hypothetical protein
MDTNGKKTATNLDWVSGPTLCMDEVSYSELHTEGGGCPVICMVKLSRLLQSLRCSQVQFQVIDW